jgi:hypothetical protein
MLFDAGSGELVGSTTVTMTHLPTWVQANAAAVPLYSADSASAGVVARLSRYTYMGVLNGGVSRLQVDVYDENGSNSQGLRGWVDVGDVLPSAPGTDWLVSSRATSLFRAADAGADVVRNLEPFSALQQVDGPVQGRIQIRVYSSDFSVLDQGWVDASATGPALPPQIRVPSPDPERTAGLRSPSSTNQQQAFLDATARAARAAAMQTGVPASVTVAQAILESDWGRSLLAQNANNYFGIKAIGQIGTAGVVWMPTDEYNAAGELYQTISAFRAYTSLTDSMADHGSLLQTSSRYAAAMRAANNPRQFAALLYDAGYSTDPAYADKLVLLMDRYDLYRLDA